MPKRIRSQRRGKGKPVFRAPSHRYKFKVRYRKYDELERNEKVEGKVIDIIHDQARTAPLALIKYVTGEEVAIPAPVGIKVGDVVYSGSQAPIEIGSTLPLGKIPPGTSIYNVEIYPGDGGKLVRASGTAAKVVSQEGDKVIIRLPSKEFKTLSANCRATVGWVAGYGRLEKPLVKAGNNYYRMKARGKYWPHVAGVAMNAVNHPHGGKRRSSQHSKVKPPSRNAPPGRKVGSIAARRTGRKKR